MADRPKTSLMESWLNYVVHHSWRIILPIVLLTCLFAWQIPHLRFETSIYDLTIEDLPQTREYEAFKKTFGCEEIVLVVARTSDVFNPKTFSNIERLAAEFGKIEGVRRVISLPGIKKSMNITGKWTLSDFKKEISIVTLLEKNIVSQDGKTTVISLILEDNKQKDSVIAKVEDVIESEKATQPMYQIGMPVVSKALTHFTEQDFLRLPPITFLLIAVTLFLLFRNVRGVLIPAGSVLIALIWTFGLMAWTHTPLCLLTMIVPIFLIAVGTAYSMYIFPEYAAAQKTSKTAKEASLNCFMQLGFPTFLAVITTIIGLGSLLINRIIEIRYFALFSCFGILAMLFIFMTFLPAVMALLPLPGKTSHSKSRTRENLLDRFLSGIIQLNLEHQKWTLGLIALIALLGIMGISRIQVETNPLDFFKDDTDISQNFKDIYRDMAGSFPMNVVINSGQDDYFEDPVHLKEIIPIQEFLATLPGVDKTISFCDYLKLVNYATNQYQDDFYALPEEGFEVRMLINSFKTMLGLDMLGRFMNENFSETNIVLRTHISSSNDFMNTQKRIEAHLAENLPAGFSFQVTGIGVVISHSSQLITDGQIKSLFLTLVLVFAIMFLLFMSFKVGIIGILPNCFPILVGFGVMGWLGIPLSMATSLIAGVAIGLAVDDTIHYLVGYNHEFKKDLNKKRALRDTVRHLGKPIIFTTVTISLGFSVLLFSSFKPTAIFGLLMVITMVSALIGDLILLPSLMMHVELVTIWDLIRVKLGKDPQDGIPLFKGLSRTQVHYILTAGNLKTYEAGSTVMTKGEISDSMYAIISGRLQVLGEEKQGAGGVKQARQVISTLETGDVVGEMGMIRSCERSATVVAVSASELLQINERMIKRLQWLYPPTAHRFFFNLMSILCDRLQNITECYLEETNRNMGVTPQNP
ncbi:MAG: MMPL family transporter [Deltaproteobacteria bacterium]|nr:MMPL family transporter [Deltaproteobacteria bacterium]